MSFNVDAHSFPKALWLEYRCEATTISINKKLAKSVDSVTMAI